MTSWFAQPLAGRPEDGFDSYAWADHTGWHFEAQPPEHIVPTGHVWAWGENDWAAWREEPGRCVGIRVRRAERMPGEGWREATVEELETTGKPSLPSLHSDTRFFRVDDGNIDWRGNPVRLLKVTSPVRVDLFKRKRTTH